MQSPQLQLYDYQKDGVAFLTKRIPEMKYKRHALLAFDTGLGKTDIGVNALIEVNAVTALIVCPPGVMEHWKQVLIKWGAASEDVIFIFETGKDRIPLNARIIICNYQKLIIANVKRQLLARHYDVLIYDEIHYLKGFNSKVVKVMYRGNKKKNEPALCNRALWKWGFTATPAPNDAMELYPTVKVHASHLLGEFDEYEKFGERYSYYFVRGGVPGYYGSRKSRMRELGKRLRPYMLVRKAEDVFGDKFPEPILESIYINVPFSEIGCDDTDTHMATLRRQIGKAKASRVVRFVADKVFTTGRKHIVFTYSREVTESICEELRNFNAVKIYGGMSRKKKEEVKQYFIDNDHVKVLVLQMQSAGTGIDGLQTVCYDMVIAETDWVDGTFKQIVGRLRRLFQKNKKVFVYLIIAEGTFDEIIIKTRRRKGVSVDMLEQVLKHKGANLMAIEDLIKENTAAMKELTAAIKSASVTGKSGSTEAESDTVKGAGKSGGEKSVSSADSKKKEKAETEEKKPTGKGGKAEKINADACKEKCKELLATFNGDIDKDEDEDAYVEATEQGRAVIRKILKKFGKGDVKIDEIAKEKLADLHALLCEAIEAQQEAENDEGEESDSEF